MVDTDCTLELQERGGFVGRTMHYGTQLGDLPEHLRELVARLGASPPRARTRGSNLPTTTLSLTSGGSTTELDVSHVDPLLLEELFGALRAFPRPAQR
ncbi:MAG: hypothetical protein JNK04_25500 [Myxococcales bacterium]|nr:hypothetical protein [Myxococcales bacterium]